MDYKLFYFLLGGKPRNRNIEQHDVFFGIGRTAAELIPALQRFWPDAENYHIDCWREVTNVNGFEVKVFPKGFSEYPDSGLSLFFINLGGYKKGTFNEFHFMDIYAAKTQKDAVNLAKQTVFYKEFGFKGAVSHIDDKYGVDVDEIYNVQEIIPVSDKSKYQIIVTTEMPVHTDELHLGYITFSKLGKM